MDAQESKADQDRPIVKRKRRWWMRVLIVLVALAVGVVSWWYSGLYTSRLAWNDVRERLQAHGHPVTYEQLEALREDVPDEVNGARILEGLTEKMEDVKKTGRVMFFEEDYDVRSGSYAYRGIDPEVLSQSKAFLEKNRDVMEELARLVDRPTGRKKESYTRFAEDPVRTLLPSFLPYRNGAKLLAIQVILNLHAGEVQRAFESNRLMFYVAGALNNEMTLNDHLVQTSILEMSTRTLEDVLCATELHEEQLKEMQHILRDAIKNSSPLNSIRSEMLCGIIVCENLIVGKLPFSEIASISASESFLRKTMFEHVPEQTFRRSQVIIAEGILPALDAASAGQWQQMREGLEHPIDSKVYIRMGNGQLSPWSEYRIPAMLYPKISRPIDVSLRTRGLMLAAVTALAAEQYQLDRGRFPESLDQLVPDYLDDVPLDPFDGKPLRYMSTDEGVLFYTIGDDEVDDGGSIDRIWNEEKERYDRPRDYGFRLLNPESRGVRILETSEDQSGE